MNKKLKKENSNTQAVSLEVLKKYSEAFNQNNIELVMECFDKNAVFDNASGSEIFGERFKGHKSLRAVFENLFKNADEVSKKLKIDTTLRPQNLSPLIYFKLCKEYEKLIN